MRGPGFEPPVYTARTLYWAMLLALVAGLWVGVFATLAVTSADASPGEVLTIRVSAGGASAEAHVVVASPLATGKPVYAPLASRMPDPVLAGWAVRVPICIGQSVEWFVGVQLRDGRVWVNGQAVRLW